MEKIYLNSYRSISLWVSFCFSGTAFHQTRKTCWAIIRSQEIETKYWQTILKRFQNPSKIPLRRTIYGLPKFYQNENKTYHRNKNYQRQNYIKWRAIKCIKRIIFFVIEIFLDKFCIEDEKRVFRLWIHNVKNWRRSKSKSKIHTRMISRPWMHFVFSA